ncbi:phosphoribosylanthranilate isomerase [Olsenella urininfantis]|uniref:phosphoribosylanthranilate isomerase n=1 Tax=Olsenella urininfantis TaxID=1871033 RepID=UPI000984EE06|nr:phosphoribosylanthranilate isomerase [Olsenella urininfantis]
MLGRRITTIVTHDVLFSSEPFTRVKLCGMHSEQDITTVNEVRPDLCGFVVNWPSSHRHVDRDQLWRLVSRLDPTIPAVGVFKDQPLGYVSELADEILDVVELRGSEGNPYITFLRELVDIPILQVIRMEGPEDVERVAQSKADLVLVDSRPLVRGELDWSVLEGVSRPYMLGGGLTPENVAQVIEDVRPWGVDLSSGVETGGENDPDKMRATVAAVRGAQLREE